MNYLAESAGGHRTERPRDQNKVLKTPRKQPGRKDGDVREVYSMKSDCLFSLSLSLPLSPTSPLPGRAVVTVTTVLFIRGSKKVEKPGVNKAHLFALRGKTRDRYARLELRRQLEQ